MRNKKIIFEEQTDQHARLITRLRYDRLTQGGFFRGLVDLYVKNDETMATIIAKIKKQNKSMGKTKIEKALEEIREGKKLKEKFNLSEGEKKNIYDLIEEDFE